MLDHLSVAHVLGFAVIERGDDVPSGAAMRHEVERGEYPRDMERLVIARRIGCAETEPLGRHAHDREHGHRVHFHAADAVADGVRVVMPVDVRH